jgi:hypothetical protein
MPLESTRRLSFNIALVASAAVVALAACGDDSPSDEEQVREQIEGLASAVAAQDDSGFCEHVDQSGLPDAADCEQLAAEELGDQTDSERLAAETLEVREVEIADDGATARVATDAEEDAGTIELRRVDGDWKVSYLGVLE